MHENQRATFTAGTGAGRSSTPRLARLTGAGERKSPLQFVNLGIAGLDALEPQALGLTYWFEPQDLDAPYSLAVRFTGRRLGVSDKPAPDDSFQVTASLEGVHPGGGPIALTHRVTGRKAGDWEVRAEGVVVPAGADRASVRRNPPVTEAGRTTFGPVAGILAPGVVVGAWPGLVGLAIVAALIMQFALSRAHGLAPGRVLALGLLASVVGLFGAKTYYRITHPAERGQVLYSGMSVQGFVVAAVATLLVGGMIMSVPFGHLLDATVPALLIGQAIGRLGCLFGGCCTGLPTTSRWGVWSSDRRIGQRRIPVQLMESGVAALLAAVTFALVVQGPSHFSGLVFVAGLAGYTAARQLLFPLRGIPRVTTYGRKVTLAVTAITLITSGGLLIAM